LAGHRKSVYRNRALSLIHYSSTRSSALPDDSEVPVPHGGVVLPAWPGPVRHQAAHKPR
jgi:hypothetical protein